MLMGFHLEIQVDHTVLRQLAVLEIVTLHLERDSIAYYGLRSVYL